MVSVYPKPHRFGQIHTEPGSWRLAYSKFRILRGPLSGGSDEKDGDGVFKSFCDVVVNDDPDDWSVFDDIDLHFDGLEWVREVASDSVREI